MVLGIKWYHFISSLETKYNEEPINLDPLKSFKHSVSPCSGTLPNGRQYRCQADRHHLMTVRDLWGDLVLHGWKWFKMTWYGIVGFNVPLDTV